MRKPPKQKRSKEMVEALLDATAATVAERGLDQTTTNHIAKRAGVSIGSLYQYFPDKESLIEALLERLGRSISQRFRERAAKFEIHQVSLRPLARAAILYGLEMIRSDALFAELVKNWHRLPFQKALDPLEQLFLVMAQPYFLRNYRDYPVENLETKLFVLINSVVFSCLRFVHLESGHLRQSDFVNALVDMVAALLGPPRALPTNESVR